MIIDSHAHYASHSFDKPARFLGWNGTGYTMEEGDRDQILEVMAASGIRCSVEPGGKPGVQSGDPPVVRPLPRPAVSGHRCPSHPCHP